MTSALQRPSRAARRVLVCVPFPPRLDARHGGKATSQLLLRLAERNQIALVCLRSAEDGPVDPAIASRCSLVNEVPHPGRAGRFAWSLGMVRGLPPWATDCWSADYVAALEQVFEDWRPDIVEIHLQAMAQYVDLAARDQVPAILVDYDPGSAWAEEVSDATGGLRRIARRLEVGAWRRYERATRPRFRAIVVFAERDVAAVAPTAGGALVTRIPLAVEVPARPLDPVGAGPPTILFVGGFGHPPNRDGAVWLAKTIFPRVLARAPAARLELVGHEPGDEIRALAGGAVSLHASVPDVTPYLDRAAVVVAPIRIGGSMRMKVLESLAAGKALVATPRAAEGVEGLAGQQLLLASDEDEMVEVLVELLLDPRRRRLLGENARRWAEANLGWHDGVVAFEQLYDRVVGAGKQCG